MRISSRDVPKIFTIGAYGFDEPGFYGAIEKAKIDTFCDIRRRRGMRGSDYAFANAGRLSAGLAERGIRYFHFLSLSPSKDLRSAEAALDRAAGIAKRKRLALSDAFVAGYRGECLAEFDSGDFIRSLGEARRVVLFCVEREPAACHRSVLAERLTADLGVRITHLAP